MSVRRQARILWDDLMQPIYKPVRGIMTTLRSAQLQMQERTSQLPLYLD